MIFAFQSQRRSRLSLILSLNLILGIVFVIRIIGKSKSDPLLSPVLLTKIGTTLVCSQIFVAFIGFDHKIPAILSIHLFAICVFLALKVARSHTRSALSAEFSGFIEDLVMNLKLGMALSQASLLALQERSETFSGAITSLLRAQSIYLGQARRHLFVSPRALEELRLSQQQPHTALKRLSSLREEHQYLSEFRRRSGQATAQARIQSLIMWVLLFALSVGVIWNSGWTRARGFLVTALVLFVLGQLVFSRITRKGRWKL